jgi:amidohydrolase
MNNIIKIRKELHKIAELSGQEMQTARKVISILESTNPDKIISEIGGYGVAAVYNESSTGLTLMFRAELDALPIQESNDFDYKSQNGGVSHKCGHDGHMTILIGLARKIKDFLADVSCKIVLLFQPAEETAEGAFAVINSEKFKEIEPDYIFGFHNLPGFPLNSIILRNGTFASASVGMTATLTGETSHAGHPEDGVSPVLAMTNIIQGLLALPSLHTRLDRASNITIIHAKMGEVAFGTSPGYAEVMSTFRSHKNKEMDIMRKKASSLIEGISATYGLKHAISWSENFPALENNIKLVEKLNP